MNTMKNRTLLRDACEATKFFLDYGRARTQPELDDGTLARWLGLSVKETVRRLKLGHRIERAWYKHTYEKHTPARIAGREGVTVETVALWLEVRAEVRANAPRRTRGRPRKAVKEQAL